MKNNFYKVLACSALALFSLVSNRVFSQVTLRINEFMAVNQTTLADDDGDYSDWIEIYNPTAAAINLSGWSLTDDKLDPQQWIFPNVEINAYSYLIVYASGKDKKLTGGMLHTNFKLSGSGEYLALTNPGGVAVTMFDPAFPPQQTDISYGFVNDTYLAVTEPSPGKVNPGGAAVIIPAPVFDKNHGFFNAAFNLQITCNYTGAKIYYTKDGSVPAANNGTLYSSPVSITGTSIIRAIAIVDGYTPSSVNTRTFLFLDQVVNQPNNPSGYPAQWGPYLTISGTSIADYEMDPQLNSNPDSVALLKEALLDIPTISIVTKKENLFSSVNDPTTGGIYIYTGGNNGAGLGWERPASFEYFNSDNSISLQANCGLRIQGGQGRVPEKSPKHSFRVVFRDEYGLSELDYPFFGDEATSKFNSITLRAGFGNTFYHWAAAERDRAQYVRDRWGKKAQKDMGWPSSHTNCVHLYLNGLYWGLYSPSERIDDDFAEAYFGGNKEDYDVIKDYAEALEGNIDAWNSMMAQANAGLESAGAYQKIQGNNPDGTPSYEIENMVDVVNLADYMLINFYGGNTDWDHHNWAALRNREKPGKGFSFICWDMEHILKAVSENVVNENNVNCPSRVFQQLAKNEDFKRLFADRVLKHCYNNGILSQEGAKGLWDSLSQIIEKPILAEAARWGDYRRDVHPYSGGPYNLYTKEDLWIPQQNFMANTYFPQRTQAFINQLRNNGFYPDVDAPVFKINNNVYTSSTIRKGDVLTMSSTEGAIYYTTDGTDPVIWSAPQEGTDIELVPRSANKRVLVPKAAISATWMSDAAFNDASWQLCSGSPGGIGYEKSSGLEPYITLDVSNDMYTGGTSPNTSCYVRIPFTLSAENLAKIKSLILTVRFDDGFVAYLNGVQVAYENVTLPLSWNSNNSANHEGNVEETYNISDFIKDLKEGTNLLAIQAVNNNITSSDFIILPSLMASDKGSGGDVSPDAEFYSQAITLNNSSHIKARVLSNGEWSAMMDQFFIIPSEYFDLKITEVHYHPHPKDTFDGDQFEFLEIKNTGNAILDLGGLTFDKGIEFEFEPNTELKGGEFIVLAGNTDYFYNRYGFLPDDEYKGKLDNNGERIAVITPAEDTIISFKYNENPYWPQQPDGNGKSLVPTVFNPDNDQDSSIFWRASHEVGGSPGADDIAGISYIDDEDTSNVDPGDTTGIDIILTHNDFVLDQNYPNPFTEVTYLHYKLGGEANIKLKVYNIMGQDIATLVNEQQSVGSYLVQWNGLDYSNNLVKEGVYFFRLEIRNENQSNVLTKKMVKVR